MVNRSSNKLIEYSHTVHTTAQGNKLNVTIHPQERCFTKFCTISRKFSAVCRMNWGHAEAQLVKALH
jgi:hypothetical protein